MRARDLMFLTGALLSLTGCTMNSNFSCNATAGDSCLTIEQVDAMTRFADEPQPVAATSRRINAEKNRSKLSGRLVQQAPGQSLWVAKTAEERSWA
ncbi:conjugal transfer protein [Legionella longbeachae]|uniref:conjugal transfer protein n=1 Tax=Legionella longbeachae TaxID=450 RepID=UPI00399CB056